MRLSAEKIKAAILDPDSAVRTAAVYYFVGEGSSDPSLMPLVVQAFEQFGEDAFDAFSFLEDLAQTDESIVWLCRKIDQTDPDPDPDSDEGVDVLFPHLVDALCQADVALLERHAATIREVRQLDDVAKAAISNRIQLASLTPQALWQRLLDFCQAADQQDEADAVDFDSGCFIVDALAKFPDQFAGEALSILERENGGDWLEVMAVQLAGALRLEAATSALIALLTDFDSWAAVGAQWALCRIGTDQVVKQLSDNYAADDTLRLEISCLLENIHSDLSVRTSLQLLEHEQEDELRGLLVRSALMNFATEAIEPARQFVLASEKTPDVLEVREALLLVCRMLDERFPEYDAWLEDSTHDVEYRIAWYKENGYGELPDDFGLGGDFDPDFDDADEGAWDASESDDGLAGDLDPHPDTVVRHDEKIGRNDPCPCGSGKKYKKCCLHKQVSG